MKRILEIYDIDKNNLGGGITRHVKNLSSLFEGDPEINLIIPEWKNVFYNRYLNKTFLSKKELINQVSNYEYIHIHGFASLIVWQALRYAIKMKKKIFYSPHYHPFVFLNHSLRGKVFFLFFIKPYLKKLTGIFTINNEDTEFFKNYSNNVYKIPHWLDKTMQPVIENKISNRILFVGKNTIDKGLDYLYKLPEGTYDVHCVTNGTLLRKDFIQHTKISDEELKKLYASASLLVVPSRYEAFSYVVLEALCQNTPVVMSDRVRIQDYLEKCDYCKTFSYGDYNDFFTQISNVIGKKVDVEKIKSIFSEEKARMAYRKIFLESNN